MIATQIDSLFVVGQQVRLSTVPGCLFQISSMRTEESIMCQVRRISPNPSDEPYTVRKSILRSLPRSSPPPFPKDTQTMTDLTKTVRRKVTTQRNQPLVVALTPEGIWLREPRRRTAYLMPYGVAFQQAVRMHVDAERRTKAATRKAKRGAK